MRREAAALVVAVRQRQHHAITRRVDVGVRQDLAVELVEELLGLRVHDLRGLLIDLAPVAEALRHRLFQGKRIAGGSRLLRRAHGHAGGGGEHHEGGQDDRDGQDLHGASHQGPSSGTAILGNISGAVPDRPFDRIRNAGRRSDTARPTPPDRA